MRVFIAHSSEDHNFVFMLAERLKKDGIDVWIDDWELKVGDSIVEKINEALENSSFLIIVFSRNSIKSDWVRKESNSFLMRKLNKKDVKILPIFLEIKPEEIPPLFSDIYGAKFNRDYLDENEYQKLKQPIKEIAKSEELAKYQDKFFENVSYIDIIIEKKQPTKKEIEIVLTLIKEEHYSNYFFKKVSNLLWFDFLKLEGYFNPSEKVKPQEMEKNRYVIPEWNVLKYLERISEKVNEPENEKYINELLNIIKEVTTYHLEHNKILDNYRTWYYFVKILCNIPNDKIPEDIIELIPIWLDSKFDTILQGSEVATKLMPKFLTDNPEDIKKAEKIISYITEVKNKNKLVIEPYWLKKVFEKYSEIIGDKCSIQVIEDLTNKIKNLLDKKEDGTYRSFYHEYDYPMTDPLEVLTFILKRVLMSKAKNNITETKEILREYLKNGYLYFPKMALFVIAENIDNYKDLFWEIIDNDIGELIMEKTLYFGDELRHLLQNLKNLTNEQRKLLQEKIEIGSVNAAKVIEKDPEKYIILHKQEIYEALSHDLYFKGLYEEMKKITKVDTELHPAIGKIEVRWGFGTSPLKKEEILEMSNEELAEFLSTFKTVNFWEGPTVNGLAELLDELAKEKPEKFTNNLTPFINTGYLYVYKIFSGIRDAWNSKKIIDWGEVFNFIKLYINRHEFWQDKLKVETDNLGATHEWIATVFADLIKDGTRDDDWSFSEEYFGDAEEVLFLLLEKLKIGKSDKINDYLTYTWNTPFGRTLEALIFLALRIARVNDKKGIKDDIKWPPNFKEKYDEFLNKKIIEGYTFLGMYLPNFYYLDKEWVINKVKNLESEKGSDTWQAFMDGYLSNGKVYNTIYNLFRPHYRYAINFDLGKSANEFLIHHICIGYLQGNESLKAPDSLFKYVLEKFNYEQIKDIIQFFWMQRGYLVEDTEENKKIREKILDFWRFLFNKYRQEEPASFTKEDKQILSRTSKLTVFLSQIDDESYEWLLLSASYVHEDFNSSFFIEYLDKLKDKGEPEKTSKYIGNIFIKMLENFTPDFEQENIRSIVEFLYKSNAKEVANKICNIYGERGYEFLRDIYDKNKNS